MPYVPTTKTLTANGIDILNTIRANASSSYQDRIPVATQENIREIGQAMLSYQPVQNEFLNALINRIGRVLITSKSYSNPLRRFKKGILEYGETVEEIFVNLIQAKQFDPETAETDVFKREIPDVNAVFHRMNLQNFYKTTISNEQLRQAFLSAQGVTDLIARIVDSMYTSAEYDEFITMKQLFVNSAESGEFYSVNIPEVNSANAKSIVSTIKGYSNALEFMSSEYNPMGVLTHTPKEKQVILLNANFDAIIDVEVLASAFNMDKAQFMGQRVLVDNFGDLDSVVAALVDEDWFMVFDNFIGFTENYNGQGLYWNYFYHIWKTFSVSPYANAILFTTDPVAVTGVTVSPSTVTVSRGQTVNFSSTVNTTGYAPEDVMWTVSGTSATTSTINSDGVLSVNSDEPNTTLTVTATSVYNNTKSGTATVTIS